jgi:hypothetical protein
MHPDLTKAIVGVSSPCTFRPCHRALGGGALMDVAGHGQKKPRTETSLARQAQTLLCHLDRARPAAASSRLARQTVNKLRSSSRNGCAAETADCRNCLK